MINCTKSLTLTATGQPRVQVGFGQARQRSASRFARSGWKPRFTSSKLRARTSASRSGMCCRGLFIRSLFGIGLGMAGRLRLIARERRFFLFAVHRVPLHEHVEVDVVRVELGAVDACELALAADEDAAAAAHPGANDHDRVQADDRADARLARG